MNILNSICSPEFLDMWIRVATPILLASLGATVCSKAGVVNLGLEGIMLISALFGVKIKKASLAILIGIALATTIMSLLMYGIL